MKNSKRVLSLVLSFALILGTIGSSFIFANATASGVWDGNMSASLSGTGTETDPYLIQNSADLAYFASSVNGGNDYAGKLVKLTTDLVINSNAQDYVTWATTAPANTWTPIGSYILNVSSKPFKGTFDGGSHTISGVYVNTTNPNGGLFGQINNATVKNLNVVNSYIEAKDFAAGLIGYANSGSSVINCSFTGLVKTKDATGSSHAAGLIAQVTGAVNVEKCFTECKIISGTRSAGLVGSSEANLTLVIKNSYSIVDIPVVAAQNTPAGIFGFAQGSGTVTVTNCYTIGTGANPAGAARELRLVGEITSPVTSSCTNSYYCQTSDSATMWGVNQGTKKAPADFTNGTVADLLGPYFEQGDTHPILADFKLEGEGTEESPYLIKNANDFAYFANFVNFGETFEDKYILLANDIEFNENAQNYETWKTTAPANTWTPIGKIGSYFKGTFDGDDHTVSGLYVKTTATNGTGLFGATQNAIIKNIKVTDSYIAADDAVAGIAGFADNTSFLCCSFDGYVSANGSKIRGVAGIADYCRNSCTAVCCSVSGKLSANIYGAGGIFGKNYADNEKIILTVKNSYCDAIYTADYNSIDNYAAGMVGPIGATVTGSKVDIIDCFSTAYSIRKNDMSMRRLSLVSKTADAVTVTSTNSYYLFDEGDNNSWLCSDYPIYGTAKSTTQFSNGTVAELLGPMFAQGTTHPEFRKLSGEGTKASPYLINNITELDCFAGLVNSRKTL
ncbi:MAG: hypothetical protein MJ091_02830, partial [Clostridia bacterium]|nr:hypothetical protein [Clostridia bacterium]